jgi:hypothetical protein
MTTNRPAALNGERRDFARAKLTNPPSDAAPTMTVIAISIEENCPLRR